MRTLAQNSQHPMHRTASGFAARVIEHVRCRRIPYALLAGILVVLPTHVTLGINTSPSLPHRVYLILKGVTPAKGELVAFRWGGGGPYRAGATFVKILAGTPGDRVTRLGRDFFVNGVAVGTAKPQSLAGAPIDAGPVGVIPPGRYYVAAPHPDSLDSRYALTGWIEQTQIIGRAHALF